jgi:hypothetical protein
MENTPDNFYGFSPDNFKDEKYDAAVENFPIGVLVFLTDLRAQQLGVVEEIRATIDGPRVRVTGIGSVPISELRLATEEDVENSRFKDSIKKIKDHLFLKK